MKFTCSKNDMLPSLRTVLDNFAKNGSRMPPDGKPYPQICLSDTFFSDTLPGGIVTSILKTIDRHKLPPAQVMVLDPFSPIAVTRADDLLSQNPGQHLLTAEGRAARGHSLLLRSIRAIKGEGDLPDPETTSLEDLITAIRIEGASLINVRYIGCWTTLPLFLVGNVAFNALLSPVKSTSEMPWDVGCEPDFFSIREAVFKAAWEEKSYENPLYAQTI